MEDMNFWTFIALLIGGGILFVFLLSNAIAFFSDLDLSFSFVEAWFAMGSKTAKWINSKTHKEDPDPDKHFEPSPYSRRSGGF